MSEFHRRQRTLPFSAFALAMSAFAAPIAAYAQAATWNFNIPAGDLGTALRAFARTSGQQLVYDNAVVKAKTSNALVGTFSAEDGLRTLLADSGLTFRRGAQGVLMISDAAAAPRSANASPGAGDDAQAATVNEVVVTAQKRTENIKDVPIPVSTVVGANLAATGQSTLKDYYLIVPSLDIQPNVLGIQSVTIRGVTTGAYNTPTVGIMVDDSPFGSSIYYLGSAIPDIDPSSLARVEVLRGPQGTLYGSNSMGGLVKFVTVDPSTKAFSGRIEAGTSAISNGSEPGYVTRASANIPASDDLALRVSGFFRHDPGYIDNPVLRIRGINRDDTYGGHFAALWKPSEEFSIKLSALYQRLQAKGLSETDKRDGLGDLQQDYIPGTGQNDSTLQSYSLSMNYRAGVTTLTSITTYNNILFHDVSDLSTIFQFGGGIGAPFHDTGGTSKVSQEFRVATPITSNVDLLAGLFYTHEDITHRQTVTQENAATGQVLGLFSFNNLPYRYQEYAGYADLTYHVTNKFDVQFGLRDSQTLVQNRTSTSISGSSPPAAGAPAQSTANTVTYLVTPRYKLSEDLMAYGRFASGYRPGGPNDAIAAKAGFPAQYSPDTVENYELGLKGDFLEHHLSIDASIYYVDWQKIQIELTAPPPSSVGYITNGASARSEGAEFSFTARPVAGLTVSGWAAYNDAVLTKTFPAGVGVVGNTGDRLPFSARYSSNLSIDQQFPIGTDWICFVGGTVSYIGDRENLFASAGQRETLPAYTKADLRAGGRHGDWTVNIYANNIADTRGVLNITDLLPFAFNYIQPRTVGVSVAKTL